MIKKIITKLYNDLPIHSRKDIDLNGKEIMDILSIKDTSKIKIIVKDLEVHILSGSIINNKDVLINYVLKSINNGIIRVVVIWWKNLLTY